MTAQQAYLAFLATKRVTAPAAGFAVGEEAINPALFPFQRQIVRWALRRGRAAIFADCGLGKTGMQLEWARHVAAHTGGDVLVLAPLAVAQQTRREGEKFGVPVTVCRAQADVRPGVNVANYEMLAHFDADAFAGVVLDESSILKSFMGKTKRQLVEAFAATPYRLCCTATPAPNDHMEIGNHSAFLGVMPAYEMLTRWFINDSMQTGHYRLKGHAAADFWAWVASWAVALRAPSDLGFLDDGFALPHLDIRHEVVRVDPADPEGVRLFRASTLSATTMHREMRLTAAARAARVAEMVSDDGDAWAVWCHTNYEADALMARLRDARGGCVEVRGSESPETKERKLEAFAAGRARVIVTKPSVAGFGLNWQHCHRAAFVGLSYSYEQFYQATRRIYRFGQAHPVEVTVVAAETEGAVLDAIRRKTTAHAEMAVAMCAATRRAQARDDLRLTTYDPRETMHRPAWLVSEVA